MGIDPDPKPWQPGGMLLKQWALAVSAMFDGANVYHVGGSLIDHKHWRDVDVVVVLSDDSFQAMFGTWQESQQQSAWKLQCYQIAVCLWGREATSLPIDFKIQPLSKFDETRKPRARLNWLPDLPTDPRSEECVRPQSGSPESDSP